MGNRLIFLYRMVGVMEGRSMLDDPAIGSAGRRPQGVGQVNPSSVSPRVVRTERLRTIGIC
jgi:hypothetical protein